MARIARSLALLPQMEKELAAARWLAAQDFQAVRVADEIEQPLTVDSGAVTFWRLVPESDEKLTFEDLARLLRAWSELPSPPFEAERYDPLAILPGRVDQAEQARAVPGEDRNGRYLGYEGGATAAPALQAR